MMIDSGKYSDEGDFLDEDHVLGMLIRKYMFVNMND